MLSVVLQNFIMLCCVMCIMQNVVIPNVVAALQLLMKVGLSDRWPQSNVTIYSRISWSVCLCQEFSAKSNILG